MSEERKLCWCDPICENIYVHCSRNDKEPYVPPTAETYKPMSAEALLNELENVQCDGTRYSNAWNGEYHRPTYMEASRRHSLIKNELCIRLTGKPYDPDWEAKEK